MPFKKKSMPASGVHASDTQESEMVSTVQIYKAAVELSQKVMLARCERGIFTLLQRFNDLNRSVRKEGKEMSASAVQPSWGPLSTPGPQWASPAGCERQAPTQTIFFEVVKL